MTEKSPPCLDPEADERGADTFFSNFGEIHTYEVGKTFFLSSGNVQTHEVDKRPIDEWFPLPDYVRRPIATHCGWNDFGWLTYRLLRVGTMLPTSIEINPKKRGGVPVIKGTRITAAEVLADIADGKRSLSQFCKAYDLDELDEENVKILVRALAIYLDRPFIQATAYVNISARRELE